MQTRPGVEWIHQDESGFSNLVEENTQKPSINSQMGVKLAKTQEYTAGWGNQFPATQGWQTTKSGHYSLRGYRHSQHGLNCHVSPNWIRSFGKQRENGAGGGRGNLQAVEKQVETQCPYALRREKGSLVSTTVYPVAIPSSLCWHDRSIHHISTPRLSPQVRANATYTPSHHPRLQSHRNQIHRHLMILLHPGNHSQGGSPLVYVQRREMKDKTQK